MDRKQEIGPQIVCAPGPLEQPARGWRGGDQLDGLAESGIDQPLLDLVREAGKGDVLHDQIAQWPDQPALDDGDSTTEGRDMCSYIVRKAALTGSAKGPNGWMRIDTANVYFDHPYHAPLDHALGIDFINAADGGHERVAVELSAQSARALVDHILAALQSGEAEHGAEPASAHRFAR